jgi:ABC-type nitrate/sulfonate/bicarbonate transport system substrate-binding protein
LAILSLVGCAALSLACGRDVPASGPPLVVARNHTHAFHLLAPAVALKKGYFQDVDVQIFDRDLLPEFLDGDKMADAMETNGIDVVVDARVRTIFNQVTRRLCLVGDWQEGSLEDVRLVTISQIQSIPDLKGKRVATSGVDSENVSMLQYVLFKQGVDPDRDVVWVPGFSRNTAAARALTDGKADAAFVSPADADQLVARGFRSLFDWKALYPEGRVERGIVAKCDVIQSRPEDVKNFLKGMVRAYRLINDWKANQAFLEPLWEAELGRVAEGMSAGAGENYETTVLSSDGMISTRAVERALKEQQELGKANAKVRLEDILDLRPMEQAVRELREARISY